jgi:5-bromo-4-chloroindolyl phosphate hydrolysis protein
MAKSSINLQLAKIFSFLHNIREAIVTYAIDEANRNSFDKNGREAFNYYMKLLSEASSNYTQRTNQRVQTDKKKFLWEAVVNLNYDHELKDLKYLAKILEEIYGWQPVQLAIHRDEGHIDKETGEKIYNYHGHIVFFMLNKEGIYTFKKRDFGIKMMQELQTIVANILNMERGTSKKITKKHRLEHRQYRQVQQDKQTTHRKIQTLEHKVFNLFSQLKSVRKNKKKTALKVRKLFKKRQENGVLHKLKQFCMNSVDILFKDLAKYPLLQSLDLQNDGLILEWMNAAQEKILFLLSENKMLKDSLINFEEDHTVSDKVYHEDDMDLPQLEEVYTSTASIEKSSEPKEYKPNIEIEDEYNEMEEFYSDIDYEGNYEDDYEDDYDGDCEDDYDGERLHYAACTKSDDTNDIILNLKDDEALEEKSLEMTSLEAEDERDENEDGSDDHVRVVSAAEFEFEIDKEISMLSLDEASDPLIGSETINLGKETDIKKEKKKVSNKIKFKG